MTSVRALVLQAAVSLAALAGVVVWALRQERPELPHDLGGLAAVALATGVYAVATAGRGERFHGVLGLSGVDSSRGESYRLTVIGYMGNNALPARAGDILRVFLLAPRARVSRRAVLGSVVAERLLDAVALAVLFAAAASVLAERAAVPTGALLLLAAAAAAVVGLALVGRALASRRRVLARLRAFLAPVAFGPRALLGRRGVTLLALSLGIWIAEAAVYVAAGRAAGLELGLAGALYVVAVTNLFSLVPAGPGYAGTFDAGLLLAVASLGHSGSAALTFLLLVRFVLFVPITIVGIPLFLGYGGWERYRSLRSAS